MSMLSVPNGLWSAAPVSVNVRQTPTHRVKDFDEWRSVARRLLDAELGPEEVAFLEAEERQQRLAFDEDETDETLRQALGLRRHVVPKAFMALARIVACHRDPTRWTLLYRLLWRVTHGEARLLAIETDDDVFRARRMEKQVTRDAHKMKAFVRFRQVEKDGDVWFVAWHRPDHFVVRMVAPFFQDRFAAMKWTILTPRESMSWDGEQLTFHAGTGRESAPSADKLEKLWLTYYGSIFNPARIKIGATKREMPVRHWATLPETAIIDELLAAAPERVAEMARHQEGWATTAVDFLPQERDLESLRAAADCCQGCPLFANATQTVFGEGPSDARLVIVGEQPGDEEDLAGRPFVGPAGRLLDELLVEAGIDRRDVYLTNAVKHFGHEQRGKRRLHKKPGRLEVVSCRAWLESELAEIRPQVVVAMGVTAAGSLISPSFKLTEGRGQAIRSEFCEQTIATFHPSAVLRTPDPAGAEAKRAAIVADLKLAWALALERDSAI
jgi:uracil-DNA glycosylase